MRFYFHEDAEEEFDRAVEYYEDSRSTMSIKNTEFMPLMKEYSCG